MRDGVETTYSYDLDDKLLTAGETSYGYDANGNLLSQTDGDHHCVRLGLREPLNECHGIVRDRRDSRMTRTATAWRDRQAGI